MRATTFVSALVSATLATASVLAPRAPRNLRVVGLSVLGSGCPYGSADVRTDPSNTALEVRLSEYVVRTGANTGAADWRKNCKITLNLEYDAGFSLSTLTTDLRGYASIPSDTQGQCQNTIDFSGERAQANYAVTLKGGFEGAFSLRSDPDIVAWSPCGGSTAILNVNTQCWISPTDRRGIIAVDRVSNRLSVHIDLRWRNC